MHQKNYYSILQVAPKASLIEIKKAYRSLARKFHPDVNKNDALAAQHFIEIKEAYEILSNSIKRKHYDQELLQRNAYSHVATDSVVSPHQILKQTEDLKRFIKTLNQRAVNNDALTDFVLSILHEDTVRMLQRDKELNKQIIENILEATSSIVAPRLFFEIAERLLSLNLDTESGLYLKIKEEMAKRELIERQNKMLPIAAMIIVLIIIIIMLFIILFNK